MRCVPSVHPSAKHDEGSAVTGFALVTPLLIAVFIGLIVVASVVRHRAVLGAAAASGVRVASAYGASDTQGRLVANQLVQAHGYDPKGISIAISHPIVNGVHLVQFVVSDGVHVPWLNRDVILTQTSRAVDEESFL